MPYINRISTLQYMGSKSRLLDSICTPIIENTEIRTVVDLFAGTGSVGYALSPYKEIVSNDLEYFAYVLNEAILNGCVMSPADFDTLFKKIRVECQVSETFLHDAITAEEHYLSLPLDKFKDYAFFSDNTPSVFNKETSITPLKQIETLVRMIKPGNKIQEVPYSCLFITYFSNAYFGIKQCCQIDAIVSVIHGLTDERQRYVLLSALMSALSLTASTTTHFAQFLKVNSKNTFKNIKEKRSTDIVDLFKEALDRFEKNGLLNRAKKQHECFNDDFQVCLNTINMDEHTLVYADPPYFKEHYSRYYHVLNTLCLYDYPELAINLQRHEYSVGRYRADRNVSDFGKRAKVIDAFQRLINICADKRANLIISYSENSLVKICELLQLTKTRYCVRVDKVKLKHSSQGRATDSDQTVKEFVFLCVPPNNNDLEIERIANRIREIKPIVDNPGGFVHNYMARKPYNVVSALIQDFSEEDDVVYDPMFGSGTTLIEASKLRRRAIGTDINPVAHNICSISLQKWDLERVNALVDSFVADVADSCSALYTFMYDGEKRILERCHFDQKDGILTPTAYWYKTELKNKLSGRKRSEVSPAFCQDYNAFHDYELARIHDHLLIPNSRIAVKDGATVFSYFCNRNLVALDRIIFTLDKYRYSYGYEVLKLIVSSSINLIKLSDKKASSQMPYWLPKENATSRNAVFVVSQKAKAVKAGLTYLQDNCKYFTDDGNIRIFDCPAQNVSQEMLADNAVDLVITDPPYTDQVPYLEYNQLWYYLFNMEDRVNMDDELVVSDAPMRDKNHDNFNIIFERIVQRTARSLKETGLFIMFYHTFDLKSWSIILEMMQRNSLRYVYQIPTASPRKSFKTVMSPKSTLDGNYLIFFTKDSLHVGKRFSGDIVDAVEMASECAERIIKSQEYVTTQDLYDQGMLSEAFEEGYLTVLSDKYKTFSDVLKGKFNYENGYWEVSE